MNTLSKNCIWLLALLATSGCVADVDDLERADHIADDDVYASGDGFDGEYALDEEVVDPSDTRVQQPEPQPWNDPASLEDDRDNPEPQPWEDDEDQSNPEPQPWNDRASEQDGNTELLPWNGSYAETMGDSSPGPSNDEDEPDPQPWR